MSFLAFLRPIRSLHTTLSIILQGIRHDPDRTLEAVCTLLVGALELALEDESERHFVFLVDVRVVSGGGYLQYLCHVPGVFGVWEANFCPSSLCLISPMTQSTDPLGRPRHSPIIAAQ